MADTVIPLANGQTVTTGATGVVYVQISQGQTLTVSAPTDPTLMGVLRYAYGGPVAVESGVESWKDWPGANPPEVSPALLPWVAPGSVVVEVTAGGEALTVGARASTPDDLGLNWATPTAVTIDVGVTAITLTDEQCKASLLYLTDSGSHAGRTDIIFPQRVGLYAIDNTTYGSGTGGGNIALLTANAGNTPLNVDAGNAGWYWCNGVDLFALSVPPTSFGAITCTSLDAGSGLIQTTGEISIGAGGNRILSSAALPSLNLMNGAVQIDADALQITMGMTTRFDYAVGFYGTAPVAQPAAPTTLADVIAALQTLGLVAT